MDNPEKNEAMEPIAVIGMSCRFPGAPDVETFWENLKQGVESISFFSDEELLASGVPPALLEAPGYVKASILLEDMEMFDASFFGFSPREAEVTDPQQRLFLECAWEVLERSGYDPETYDGRIGVYAGASISTYLIGNLVANDNLIGTTGGLSILIDNDKDHVPTRVSYTLNLRGPSVHVSTACSTSLVAVHMACQSLLDYHNDMALAGGVTVNVWQKRGYRYQIEGIASPDGHCRTFDARAQGTVGGSGAGIVVLKRLEEAVQDGDNIEALILGSAVNNDGSLKVGYTAPSVEGQAAVIAEAHALAGTAPDTITYIEAHGTGTRLGDPVEIEALSQAFSHVRTKGFCAVGSVKTNTGHLDAAAGVAGLIKTTLALKHKIIPPSLHFERSNPVIGFENSPFYVNARVLPWDTGGAPRRAGVSSFAVGGTNAHVILEEWVGHEPAPCRPKPGREYRFIGLSAKTETALDKMAKNLAGYLKRNPGTHLADAAYTLQMGRKEFPCRRMLVCHSVEDAAHALETLDPKRILTGSPQPGERPLAFMFPGLGDHYVNMGLGLYRDEPVFRREIEHCCRILEPHLGLNLLDVIYPDGETGDILPEAGTPVAGSRPELDFKKMVRPESEPVSEAAEKLNRVVFTHPAVFAVEYALARLWISWGIHPQAVIGYSIGEYTAACLAGVMSLQDVLLLVAKRAQLIRELPPGAMLAVSLSEKEIMPLLGDGLALAAVNGPQLTVVSGPESAAAELENRLNKKKVTCRRLQASHAFHSPMMEPLRLPLKKILETITLNPVKIPFLSNVSGTWITDEEARDPDYWVQHTCSTVRFSDGIEGLWEEPARVLLEVGPGQSLGGFALLHPARKKVKNPLVISSLRHHYDGQPDEAFLLNAVGKLWVSGVPVDWQAFYAQAGEKHHRLPLPTYPFEKRRYWIDGKREHGTVPSPRDNTAGEHSLFTLSWKQSPLPITNGRRRSGGCWLVFVLEGEPANSLVHELRGRGIEVITVSPARDFEQLDALSYSLDPTQPGHYSTLLKNLAAMEKQPETIIHLWSLDAGTPGLEGDLPGSSTHTYGFYSLICLIQALEVRGLSQTTALTVISNQLFDVTGEEKLRPEKAALLGPVMLIPLEYPHIRCQYIDVHYPPAGPTGEESLISQLSAELQTGIFHQLVAYRGRHRWVQQTEPITFTGPGAHEEMPLRQKGVYLVTGGLGGMGLEIARYLARKTAARLVLADCREFPPKEQWPNWTTDKPLETNEWDFIGRLESQIDRMLQVKGIEEYPGLGQKLDRLCTGFVCRYLLSCFRWTRGKVYRRSELPMSVIPKFRKFFDYFLHILSEDGIIKADHQTMEFLISPDQAPVPDRLLKDLEHQYPMFRGLLKLLDYSAAHYKKVFSGEIENVTVFYSGTLPTVPGESKRDPMEYEKKQVYLMTVRDVVVSLVQKNPGRTIRILEVGGGTGGLTGYLVDALEGRDIEYHFTDLGKTFVVRAEQEAARRGLDFMHFGLFDISKDPGKQGYESRSFDIIAAFDVVHATPRLGESLQNLQQLLAPGGVLFLIEGVQPCRWGNLIWGLQTGWWFFEDIELRKHSPLLTLEQWTRLMDQFPFETISIYPREKERQARSAFGLIAAQVKSPKDAPPGLPPLRQLDRDDMAEVQSTIRTFTQLEEGGAEIIVKNLNVTDLRQVQALLSHISEHQGNLDGIIHAAALPGKDSIRFHTLEKNRYAAAPMLQGTRVLDEAVKAAGITPGFLMLCSYGNTLFPGKKEVDRCAGYWFQGVFAQVNSRSSNIRTIAIDWGGLPPPDTIARVMEAIPADDCPSWIMVLPTNTEHIHHQPTVVSPRIETTAGLSPDHPRPNLKNRYVEPQNKIEQDLAAIWQELFGIREIGIFDNFLELGGDSLLATQMATRILDTFHVTLQLRLLFEKPTVAELAEHIRENRRIVEDVLAFPVSSREGRREGVL